MAKMWQGIVWSWALCLVGLAGFGLANNLAGYEG